MNWEEVIQLIRLGESSRLRFFGQLSDEETLGTVMVGMSNDSGGRIVLGLDLSNTHLCGSDLDQAWLNTFTQNHLSSPLEVTLHRVPRNDRYLVVLEIEEGRNKPYYFDNMCFVMEGKTPKLSPLIKSSSVFKQVEKPKPEEIEKEESPKPEKPVMTVYQPHPQTQVINQVALPDAYYSLNERQKQALEMIQRDDYIKNKRYRQLFNVSHKTAHLELVGMVAKGLIQSDGLGRNTRYILKA